jgi:hypothetical protein
MSHYIQIKARNLFFEDYYLNILNDIFSGIDCKKNILIFNAKILIPFIKYSYNIKKFGINIHLIIDDKDLAKEYRDSISGEEIDSNIVIDNIFSETKIKYDIIIDFHLYCIDKFEVELDSFYKNMNHSAKFYAFCSLIEKVKRSEWRTVFRDDIKKIIGMDYGNVLLYEDMNELIETNQNRKKYKCESFDIYKDSEYIFYGKNTVYKIVLEKIGV